MPRVETEAQDDLIAIPSEAFTILNLEGWFRGEFPLDVLKSRTEGFHDPGNVLFALEISAPVAVHDSCDLSAQSFAVHSGAAKKYMRKAALFMQKNAPSGWTHQNGFSYCEEIIAKIGKPPVTAHPIYFISSETPEAKEVVYIGRTAAKDGRFRGGHHAITKLHAPAYDGAVKRVYMASVLVRTEETEWINLELINPTTNAELYLSEIELNLIYSLQPTLNDQGKTSMGAGVRHPVEIYDPYDLLTRSKLVWPRDRRVDE